MKKNIILVCFLIVQCLVSQLSLANCESTIVEGNHSADTKKEAKAGALEEAVDACYPGEATKLDGNCTRLKNQFGENGKKLWQCSREVSCSICGEDLSRKYEALN